MKVYLENSALSRVGKDDVPIECNAMRRIIDLGRSGALELWTSLVTQEEMAAWNDSDPLKQPVKVVFSELSKVEAAERQKLLGFQSYGDRYTWISQPLIEDNPVWLRLRKFRLDDNDERHLLTAIGSQMDVFVALDNSFFHSDKGADSRRGPLEKEFQIRIRRPSELLAEV